MKKTHTRKIINTLKHSKSQRGSTKNWFANKRLGKQKLKILFVLSIALIGVYLVLSTMAASKPKYFGNDEYWAGRIRACESGDGIWNRENYGWINEDLGTSGAYQYSKEEWNYFGGFGEAYLAPAAVQDDKFKSDWNNPSVGSNIWVDTIDCWKPAGIIAGAPCLPVPKNPDPAQLTEVKIMKGEPLDEVDSTDHQTLDVHEETE